MKISLPTSWGAISIRQFTELTRVKEMELEPIEQMAQLIAVLSNQDYEKISQLSIESLKKAYQSISFIDNPEFPDKVEPEITIDGVKYIANLDIRRITAGAYIDIKEFTKDPKETPYNIHNIMACLYIPEGMMYNVEVPHEAVAEEFYEKMPITFAFPVAVFFWNLLNDSMQDIRDSLESEMLNKIRKINPTLNQEKVSA
jgi:hypothetical protein